jgi:cellobiose-specific phosphotransferase system component IIB
MHNQIESESPTRYQMSTFGKRVAFRATVVVIEGLLKVSPVDRHFGKREESVTFRPSDNPNTWKVRLLLTWTVRPRRNSRDRQLGYLAGTPPITVFWNDTPLWNINVRNCKPNQRWSPSQIDKMVAQRYERKVPYILLTPSIRFPNRDTLETLETKEIYVHLIRPVTIYPSMEALDEMVKILKERITIRTIDPKNSLSKESLDHWSKH